MHMLYDLHKATVRYDLVFNLLSVRRQDSKTTYALRVGSVAVHFHKNEPVGLEFSDAENFLKKMFNKHDLNRGLLSKITSARFGFSTTKSDILILIAFILPNRETINATYTIPNMISKEIAIRA